ncbi:PROTEIN RALF-LIKE 19 [Salix purpurea]|uniref:PROTEIN RALF-LIKE 19 n=1 Tax=Salix purpurea TaxID=77065 RepID=A0A9Q0WK16_SALPP|nr:PROTEIN RALF-LIKE 19 [Salix purpurea]
MSTNGFQVLAGFLMLATAMVAESTTSMHDADLWGLSALGHDNNGFDFMSTEMVMDSEINHRLLAQKTRYISYGALRANSVPCNRRGSSYYNCNQRQKANPYRRGCSTITEVPTVHSLIDQWRE